MLGGSLWAAPVCELGRYELLWGGYQLGWAVPLVGGGQLFLYVSFFHLEDGIWCHFSAVHVPAGFHMSEWDQTLGPMISASC